MAMTLLQKHPGPGGSEIHSTGTDQSIHSGGLGVSMREISEKKLTLNLDPSRALTIRNWAMGHIDRIRNTGNRHESLAGSTIQRLNNLYYTADNYLEVGHAGDHEFEPEQLPLPINPATPWWELDPVAGPLHARTKEHQRRALLAREVAKGQPDGGDLHVNQPLGSRKKKAKRMKVGARAVLQDRFNKHFGPGPHANGSPQSVHGSGRGKGPSRQDIADQTEEGGFTVDPATGAYPETGFMVSVGGFEKKYAPGTLTLEAIGEYRGENWEHVKSHPNAYWGGWKDTDGTVYFDISVHTEDLDEAVRVGNEFGQLAIFHLDSFSEIRLDDDGTSLSDFKAGKVAA